MPNMLHSFKKYRKVVKILSVQINRDILQKGWDHFDIMHLDRHVASVYEGGRCCIKFSSFLPYNLYLKKSDDIDERVNNLNYFYHWCASRVLTPDRKYAKEIMNSIGAAQAATDKDRAKISLSYHGLSLTYVYWIRAKGERIRFADISLYRHSLSDTFSDVSLRGKQLTAQNAELLNPKDAAGDVGTSGVAPKAWVRRGDSFYLLKDGDLRDVKAELLASRIVDCFEIQHVSYHSEAFDGTPVSCCKIITDETHSIVPFDHYELWCVNHGKDSKAAVRKLDAYGYNMMNVIDNKTNRPVSLHPLMDFNKAFLSYDTVDGSVCQTADGNISQKQAAINAVREVGLNQRKPIDEAWFEDEKMKAMFLQRLSILKNEAVF